MPRPSALLSFENSLWQGGVSRLAGVDEAGRGPLAGAVVAAAVVFDPHCFAEGMPLHLTGLTDSKQLTGPQRARFFDILQSMPGVAVGVGEASVEEVDKLNILKATHLAMRRALEQLNPPAEYALVDGRPVPGLPCRSRSLVKGDSRSLSIAAASVIAKETRDAQLLKLDELYPGYGFARHKGYGTKDHLEALRRLGPTPCHRTSFKPVRDLIFPALEFDFGDRDGG